MSLSTTADRVSYSGNGSTTNFAFSYKFVSQSDLVVIVKYNSTGAETTQVLNTDYTISGTVTNGAYESGATVVFTTAPASGYTVIIYRDMSDVQDLELTENGPLPATNVELQFDKLVMMIQRVKNKLARSIGLKEGYTASFDPTLPALMTNSAAITTKSDGSGLEYTALSDIFAGSGLSTSTYTADRALKTNGSGVVTASTVTSTEQDYLIGVTSAIQTQLDAKQLRSTLTTKGDLYVATASNTVARQGVGPDDQKLVAASSQTNGIAYHTELTADYLQNVGIACSVGSNALTISLKTAAGSDASSTDPIKVGFRSSTLTTGYVSLVKVTGALSTVISSGSTAGHANATDSFLYVYLINNAGTAELAWSTALFDEKNLVSTTAEGGAGAADSNSVMYSTTARSSVAFRCIGRLISNQTTAGTWAAVPTNIQVGAIGKIAVNETIYAQANGNPASASSGNPVIYPSMVLDSHNGYNASTGRFTCPSAGIYEVSNAAIFAAGISISVYIYKNAGIGQILWSCMGTDVSKFGSALVSCAAGDILDVRPNGTLDATDGYVVFKRVSR